jgi:hypothetical protein
MNSADHVGTVAKTGLVVGLVVGLGLGLGLVVGLGLGSVVGLGLGLGSIVGLGLGLSVGVGLLWRRYPRLPALAGAMNAASSNPDTAMTIPIRR